MTSHTLAVQAPIDQGAHSSMQSPLTLQENDTDLSIEEVGSKWYLFVYNKFFSTTFHAYLESATSLESARAQACKWLLEEVIQLTHEKNQMLGETILWSDISDSVSLTLTIAPNIVRLYLRGSDQEINTWWWLEVYTYIRSKEHNSIAMVIDKTPSLEAAKKIALKWVSKKINQLICDYTQLSQQLSV
jgi:hypothetical protein